MLRGVTLARQWRTIASALPAGWSQARLSLFVTGQGASDRAAALLGPLTPGRVGDAFRFEAAARGTGTTSPAAVERALARLDAERIVGRLELVAADETSTASGTSRQAGIPLAAAWDALTADLPSDWSDLYAQIELTSSDHLDPAALALAPVNPARYDPSSGFRFRCARSFGYGAAPSMVRRCLARLDEQGIPGAVTVLRVLSDTRPVGTQGPVWYVGGKVV